MQSRIIVVEDERAMREMLALALHQEGYEVRPLASGAGLPALVREFEPDLIVLDVGLPGADGTSLVPSLRALTRAPIVMLTANHEKSMKLRALGNGADHYLTKPIDIDEFLLHVTAALRRPDLAEPTVLRYDVLELHPDSRRVYVGGRLVDLTPREYALLEILLRTPGRAFSKDEFIERVWGIEYDGDTGIVDRYISYLRAKLEEAGEPRLVQTVRGVGYALRKEAP